MPLPRPRLEGPGRDSIELSRYDPRTGVVTKIARLPDREVFAAGTGAAAVVFGMPLRRSLHVVVCDSTILAAFSDSARAWHVAMNGRDSNGLLWIGMSPVDADSPSSWLRVALDGSVVDTVYLAARARIVSVSGDRLLVVRRDADDVEHLGVYRIPSVAARAEVPVRTAPRNAGCYRSVFEIDR